MRKRSFFVVLVFTAGGAWTGWAAGLDIHSNSVRSEAPDALQRGGPLPWPAEPFAQAINLTAIEGPGVNDFHVDLSGAVWNPVTQRLWVCRNGPNASQSKLWAIVENNSTFSIDTQGPLRGEWTGFGDFEGIALPDLTDTRMLAIIEGEERIKEFDVSTYGVQTLLNDWNTSGCLPGEGGEGIAFVPDSHLAAAGFVDDAGQPYTSQGGMGGLVFVGHQALGRIYVFDLVRGGGPNAFTVVGEYVTGFAEIAELSFDSSTGLLYVLHDASFDVIEALDLSSVPSPGIASCGAAGSLRRFNTVASYSFPTTGNFEGMTIVSRAVCENGGRRLFLTIDDGGPGSLFMFEHFTPGCEVEVPAASVWGLVVLGLLVTTAATILAGRRIA